MFQCSTRAPTRVDLAGGTLDMWPLASIIQEKFDLWKSPVLTINTALTLYASCHLKIEVSKKTNWRFRDLTDGRSFDGTSIDEQNGKDFPLHRGVSRAFANLLSQYGTFSVEMSTDALAPKGSGLGGSSSVVVAILGAMSLVLKHLGHTEKFTRTQLCELGKNIEAGVLGGLAGNQDHFGAAFGGVQAVEHSCFGSASKALQTNGSELMSRVVLAHSGVQHFSIFNNWLILEKVLTGNKDVLSKMAAIGILTHELVAPLTQNNWSEVGRILSAEWQIRRSLADGISTPELDQMHTASIQSGALGAKVCGAGGGGVLVAIAQNLEQKKQMCEALKRAGGQILNADFDDLGLVQIIGSNGGIEKIL